MTALPEPVQSLVEALNQLPGIGPRSAERLALHLVQGDPDFVRRLAHVLVDARQRVQLCSTCGALTEQSPCAICSDARRDAAIICVIERPVDILAFEKAGAYRGKYHVLGGRISPLNGIEPEDLRIAELDRRLAAEPVREVILALGSDVEGDATSHYLARRLAGKGISVTRLAHGLPVGSGLDQADELTLSRALQGRTSYEL
jgi:recombination protein RecR